MYLSFHRINAIAEKKKLQRHYPEIFSFLMSVIISCHRDFRFVGKGLSTALDVMLKPLTNGLKFNVPAVTFNAEAFNLFESMFKSPNSCKERPRIAAKTGFQIAYRYRDHPGTKCSQTSSEK